MWRHEAGPTFVGWHLILFPSFFWNWSAYSNSRPQVSPCLFVEDFWECDLACQDLLVDAHRVLVLDSCHACYLHCGRGICLQSLNRMACFVMVCWRHGNSTVLAFAWRCHDISRSHAIYGHHLVELVEATSIEHNWAECTSWKITITSTYWAPQQFLMHDFDKNLSGQIMTCHHSGQCGNSSLPDTNYCF